jgi:hypothetical protein
MRKQLNPYVGLAVIFLASWASFAGPYGYVVAFQSGTNDGFFLFGREFFLEFLDHPAGPLRYAGRFLGQFYHYVWLGSLVVSACITSFGALFYGVLRKFDRNVPVVQTLLPCVLLLVLHASTFYLVSDTLGLCASCGAFLGYLSLPRKLTRRLYALVVTPAAYFVLGAYFWLFVAWVVLFEWLDGPAPLGLAFKIGYPVYSVAVPLVAWRWVFPIPLSSAIACPLMLGPPFRCGSAYHSFQSFVADCVLGALVFAVVLGMPFLGRLPWGSRWAAFWRIKPGRRSRVALAVALPALAVLLHLVCYNAPLATLVGCHQLYQQRQWDALLRKAKDNPFGDVRLQFMTNFALYHQGKLLDEMFRYPQIWGTRGLVFNYSGKPGLPPAEDDSDKGMYNSDLYYELGHVNIAYRHAYNCMCLQERTYDVLKRMAQCGMANGNYQMAAKYLNLLEQTLFHHGFARRWKAIIADPQAREQEFAEIRSRLPKVDGYMFGHGAVPFLVLLESKPDNRMASDYLMAWLLLDKTETSIASIGCPGGIEQFRKAGYASIPTYCQEAILLEQTRTPTPLDLQGFRYDDATVARVDRFFGDLAVQSGPKLAAESVRSLYGDMYLFYHFFVNTPRPTQQTAESRGRLSSTSRVE